MISKTVLGAALAFLVASPTYAGPLQDHPGRWLGEMKTPKGQAIKVGAELFTRADGGAWASVSVPGNDVYDIPVKVIVEEGDSLDLDIVAAKLKLTWDKDHFHGEWKQGSTPLAFDLVQVADFPKKVRPQTPTGPFPYKEESLAIKSTDGVILGATLTIPAGTKRPNLVVLVHGSGPGTRNEAGAGHESFAVLADYLARQGIAVLRYDKRGVSRSTGDYENHTPAQLADDLAAVIAAGRARKQFARVGVIGLSEGPGVAAAVAARDPKSVDFVVSLAGVGLPGMQMMLLQDRQWARDNGADPAEVERLTVYVRSYYETLIAHAETAPRIAALKDLQAKLSPEDKALIARRKMNMGSLSLAWAEKPVIRLQLMSDTSVNWRRVRQPVLALNGSLDHQVPPESLDGIVAALKAGGNRKVEAAVLPSLNHLFQTAKTGEEEEYSEIEETMAPVVLQRVAVFVKKQR